MKTKSPLFRFDRLLLATVTMCLAQLTQAQTTNTWTGSSGGAWTTGGNWSSSGVPTSTSVVRVTNTNATYSVGINGSTTSTNNAAGFRYAQNGTLTFISSSAGLTANNSNSILRVFGWVEGGQTNLIINDSTSGHMIFTNNASATATTGLLRFTLSSGGVINVSNVGGQVSLMSLVQDFAGTTNTITKTGAGTLIIGGTNVNTWAGGLVLDAGVLQLNKSSALGAESGLGLTINGGSLDNGSGAAVTLSNYVQTWGGNFSFIGTTNLNLGAGAVNLSGTRTVTVDANALTVGGTITNTGGITKAGAGTLILNGANTFSGTATVNAGTLSLGNANALQNSLLDTGTSGAQVVTFTVGGNNTYNIGGLSGSDDIALSANRISVGANSTDSTYAGALSGTGGLDKVGAGTLTLTGANTYNGGTLVSAGRIIGDTRSLQNSITNNSAVTFSQTTNGTYGSVMSGTGGTVTKTGSGTMTFTQNNTYTGATTITGGRLVVNGSQGSSAVTVDSGASLGGTGTVGGLTVSGLLAPGNSIGTLSAGNTTFNGGGSFELEIFDWVNTAGTGWDLLTITGDLTLNNTSGNTFAINLVSLANSTTPGLSTDWNQNASFTNTFITYSGSLLGTSFASNLFTVNTNSFQNTVNGTFSITNVSGGLALLYTTSFVPSADFIWNTTDGDWSVGANWADSSAPTNGSALIFAGASGGVSTNDSQLNDVASVTFSNTAGSYTISGSAFTNGVIGIVNNSSSAQTINNDITLGGIQSFNAASGDLTFGGAIDNNGNLFTVTGSSNTALNGIVSGNGALTKSGSGSLTLGGNNTFSGALAVNAGTVLVNGTQAATTLNIGGGTLLLGASDVLVNGATITLSTGTVNLGGFSDTITTFNQSGGVFTNGTLTATTYGLSGGTVGGTLGAGTANVTGAVSLSGAINSTLNVNSGGTLTLAANDRIDNSSAVTVNAGTLATVTFNDTVGTLVLNNGGSITGTGTITAGTYTLNGGSVGANLGTGTATSSAGTTTLNGTLAGDLTVSGGELTLGAADRLANSSAVTVSSGTLNFGGLADTVGSFSLSGGVFTNGTVTTTTYALSGGTMGGTLGAGTANVTGGVTLSGVIDSTLNINTGGTLTLAAADRINNSSAVTVNAGTLATATFNDTVGSLLLTNNGSITGTGTITASTYTLNGGTVGANLGAGTANVSAGTTTLSGTLAAATLNINGGTLGIDANGRIDNATAVNLSSGALNMNNFNDTVGSFTITGGTLSGTGTISADAGGFSLQGGTIDANLGTGSVTASTGTTAVNGTVAGNVAVSGGSVNLGAANRIGNSSAVNVSSGALNLGGNDTVGAVTLTGGTIGGSGVLTGTSYDVQAGTISAALGGSGAMTKTGAGVTTLSGDNSTYSGAVTVNDGTLLATTSGALGTGLVTMTNGSAIAASGTTLINNFTIGALGGTSTNFGSTTVLMGYDVAGNSPTQTTVTASTVASGVTAFNMGKGTGALGNNLTNTFGGTNWAAADASTGVANGRFITFGLEVSSTNTVIKLTTLSPFLYRASGSGPTNATLQYSIDGGASYADLFTTNGFQRDTTAGSYASIDLSVGGSVLQDIGTNGVAFRWVNFGATAAGGTWYVRNLSGDDLAINGQVGTILTTETAGTGSLGINEAGSATFSGNVTVNNTATFTAAENGLAAFSGVVSGTGTALSKTGAGTVTLSGSSANTFTGMTTVTAGTLQLNKAVDTAAIAGDIEVTGGAFLLLSSSGNVADAAEITLSGGTITRGTGVSEVFGNLNVTAESFIDFGTSAAGTLSFGTYTASALLTVQSFLPGNKLQFASDFDANLLPTGGNLSNANFAFSNGFTTGTEEGFFTITAIPEPSTYLAAAGLLSLMLWPSRKRIIRDTKKIIGLTLPMRARFAARLEQKMKLKA